MNYKTSNNQPVRTRNRVTMKMLKGALDEKEYENFERINKQISQLINLLRIKLFFLSK